MVRFRGKHVGSRSLLPSVVPRIILWHYMVFCGLFLSSLACVLDSLYACSSDPMYVFKHEDFALIGLVFSMLYITMSNEE